MTVHIDVLLAAICIAVGAGFALGVLVASTSPYHRRRKKNTRRPPLTGCGATGVQRQEVNHGNR